MSNKNIDLPLSDLAQGAIQEKLDYELNKIFTNIHDQNTKPTDKRTVTIKLDFVPDKNRQTVMVESNFTTKLANITGVSTTVLTGKDLESGNVEAQELKSNMPGQGYIDDEGEVRTDVGEPVDVIEKEQQRKNIIDLQRGSN